MRKYQEEKSKDQETDDLSPLAESLSPANNE
jgi:hypothetical protein